MSKKNSAQSKRSGRGVDGKPGRRYELRDEAYERIAPLLPKQQPGGKWADHRAVLNGMFWILNSGAQWRDMPERYGKWETVDARGIVRANSVSTSSGTRRRRPNRLGCL